MSALSDILGMVVKAIPKKPMIKKGAVKKETGGSLVSRNPYLIKSRKRGRG